MAEIEWCAEETTLVILMEYAEDSDGFDRRDERTS